jgi:4-hydroxy-3-methylbut-2-enyl diphosphate reductase
MPTYFIQTANEIISEHQIRHFDLVQRRTIVTDGWLPAKRPLDVVVTCGASCPDVLVDDVLLRVRSFFEAARPLAEVLEAYPESQG